MCILNSLYIMYTLNCLASRKPSGCLCFAARHPLPLPRLSPVAGYSVVVSHREITINADRVSEARDRCCLQPSWTETFVPWNSHCHLITILEVGVILLLPQFQARWWHMMTTPISSTVMRCRWEFHVTNISAQEGWWRILCPISSTAMRCHFTLLLDLKYLIFVSLQQYLQVRKSVPSHMKY